MNAVGPASQGYKPPDENEVTDWLPRAMQVALHIPIDGQWLNEAQMMFPQMVAEIVRLREDNARLQGQLDWANTPGQYKIAMWAEYLWTRLARRIQRMAYVRSAHD
jgi:hypothetical protein